MLLHNKLWNMRDILFLGGGKGGREILGGINIFPPPWVGAGKYTFYKNFFNIKNMT